MSTVDIEITVQPKGRRKPRPVTAVVSDAATARIPRIARLMALAIKFQDLVDRGEVRDCADLARLGYVTRARLTQIMNLILLAPDIQEQLLSAAVSVGEHRLRNVIKLPNWHDQRNSFELALKVGD